MVLKVFQINVDWDQGGPGTIGKNIQDQLMTEGHESFVAYARGNYPRKDISARIASSVDSVIHGALSRLTDKEGLYSRLQTRRLIAMIEAAEPDIVQLHTLLGHYLNYPMLFRYLRKKGMPVVWTIHDTWAYTGHCINYERAACDRWKTLCHDCPLQKDYPNSWFADRSRQHYLLKKQLYADMPNLHVVVPSMWLAQQIKESFLQDRDIQVIPNGIDLTVFHPGQTDIRKQYGLEGKKLLLAVSFHWSEMKGYSLLCDIAKRLKSDWVLAVVGNKDASRLPPGVLSIPAVGNPAEIIPWYRAADVFLNPTLGDNFPTVNMEALSCGAPIVTCDTGGSPEIAGNQFGRVVYSKSSDEFLQKIEECLAEQYSREDCHQYALRYDRTNTCHSYIELYRRMLGGT